MKSNCTEYKELGECIELIIDHRGKTPKKLGSDWVNVGIPTISANNVNDGKLVALDSIRYVTQEVYKKWMREKVKQGDCFLVSEGATLGECLYWDNDYPVVLGQRIFCIRTSPKILYAKYFYAYMNSAKFQADISGRATGSSVSGLRQTEVLKLKVKILPMDQQIFIGDIYYQLNKKIEINTKINQTLEQIAQAIFKSWFVDFEPVRAKIAAKQNGQDPERAAIRAISGKTDEQLDQLSPDQLQQLAATAALFPDELVDSELGEIPKGWKEKKVSDWGDVVCGKTPPKNDPSNYGGNIPFIKIPDMHGKVFATITSDSLSTKGSQSQKKKKISKGSVCVSCIATVGQIVIASGDSHTNQQINSIVPSNMAYTPYLYFSMLEQNGLLHDLASGGSATLNLNTGNFSKINLVYPGEKLLVEYSRLATPLLEAILEQDKQSQSLCEIREFLLPKLLSGEIGHSDEVVA